jgi:hypothetical protein
MASDQRKQAHPVPLLCVERAPVMRGQFEESQVTAHSLCAPVMRRACPCYAWTTSSVPLLCVDNSGRPAVGHRLRWLDPRP